MRRHRHHPPATPSDFLLAPAEPAPERAGALPHDPGAEAPRPPSAAVDVIATTGAAAVGAAVAVVVAGGSLLLIPPAAAAVGIAGVLVRHRVERTRDRQREEHVEG